MPVGSPRMRGEVLYGIFGTEVEACQVMEILLSEVSTQSNKASLRESKRNIVLEL